MATNGLSCAECSAPITPGQRYCLTCGARCGPLPGMITGTLGAMLERGRPPEAAAPGEDEPAPKPREPLNWKTPLGAHMPTPRVATLAVMGMLAMGVLIGSLGHVSVEQLASAPSIVLNLPSTVASGLTGSGAGSGGGSGAAQQTQTIVQTTPLGSPSGSGSTSNSTSPSNTTPTPTSHNGLPPIGHLFLIMLSQQGFNQTFAPAARTYLSTTLVRKGELMYDYYGVAGSPLANEIALLSGQGPTPQTESNCPNYSPLISAGTGADGQVLGSGCVYPPTTETLMDQLTLAHMTWKAYIEGMPKPCSHTAKHPYAVWTNPIVFFDSVAQSSDCKKDDVGLGALKTDLKSASTTPTFSYIAPSPCDDGSSQPCSPGAPSGLGPAVKFLKTVVPEIQHSAAYKANDSLILITFDQAPQTGAHADSSSCCTQPTYPNAPATSTTTTAGATTSTTTTGATVTPTTTTPTTTTSTPTTPPGGGQVGLLLLSHYVKPNIPDTIDTLNHFSLLEGIEEMFGLSKLGFAKATGLLTWSGSVFSGP
jgi:hypothetical protein